ncbi:hypothetical protein BDR07DRAFT_1375152 [Suillus spraguei]|nr:hypothetical protein BDR07DRAFT_1375152 [Suillus spraguei]
MSDVPNPSQGIPAAELASKFELDSQKLIPILRCCAANGWVRETRNAGRETELQLYRTGWRNLIGNYRILPDQTAFQIALKTPLLAFSWIVENPDILVPVADHFQVFGDMSTPSIVADYPWSNYKLLSSLIVEEARKYLNHNRHPSFRGIVQDMENVVALTSSIMEERRPHDIENGVLKVEAHDFFQPQPRIGNDYSFILRHIILAPRHDWPDKEASRILIIDMVAVPNVDSTTPTSIKSLSLNSEAKGLDSRIPSHFGSASRIVSGSSMHMLDHDKRLREVFD